MTTQTYPSKDQLAGRSMANLDLDWHRFTRENMLIDIEPRRLAQMPEVKAKGLDAWISAWMEAHQDAYLRLAPSSPSNPTSGKIYVATFNEDYVESQTVHRTLEAALLSISNEFKIVEVIEPGEEIEAGSPEFWSRIADIYDGGKWKGATLFAIDPETLEVEVLAESDLRDRLAEPLILRAAQPDDPDCAPA
jgi:hypothetical protein